MVSGALENGIESFWPIFHPSLNNIPQFLPSLRPVSPLIWILMTIKAKVDDARQIPCHLVGPSRL